MHLPLARLEDAMAIMGSYVLVRMKKPDVVNSFQLEQGKKTE